LLLESLAVFNYQRLYLEAIPAIGRSGKKGKPAKGAGFVIIFYQSVPGYWKKKKSIDIGFSLVF